MKDKDQIIKDILSLQEDTNRLFLTYRVENWMSLDLTIDQLKSLIIIYTRGKISFKDLAVALNISRSNITGLADRLIQSGLLTREQNIEDRRVQFLMLTDKGREIINNIRQEIITGATSILEDLNIEELIALRKGISALVKAAEKRISSTKNVTNPIMSA